jgi:hypothetical protein
MELSYGFRTAEELRCGVGINCGGTELRLQSCRGTEPATSDYAEDELTASELQRTE